MKRRIRRSGLVFTIVLMMVLSLTGTVAAQQGRVGQIKDSSRSLKSSPSLFMASFGVDDTLTPTQLAGSLVGAGPTAPTIHNVHFVGGSGSSGYFTAGTGNVGFESGVVLGTGQVSDVLGPNTFDNTSWDFGTSGDPDLDVLVPGYSTYDATVLEFDFECPAGTGGENMISFSYVFTSEEYNEWVNSGYNDVFGFFLNGTNIALLPDGVTPVSINNVNNGYSLGGTLPGLNPANPAYYRNNDLDNGGPFIDIEADGLTVVLGAQSSFNPGVTNHLKLAIADGGDHVYDSWVFIKEGSFVCEALNQPPVAEANGPYSVDEGSAISLDGTGSSDPDNSTLTYNWSIDSALCSFNDPTSATPELKCTDNGNFTATLIVGDGQVSASDTASVTVANVAPAVSIDSVSPTLIPVGGSVTATGSFTDAGTNDTHTAVWITGGVTSTGTVVQGAGFGSVADTLTYVAPGIYTIELRVTDDDGGVGTSTFGVVVVYNPNGGFVTGGGWIYSHAGAYVPDPKVEGKATFGFVSKYKKGASAPSGNTEFQLHANGLNFHTSSYEWLVITTGKYAILKGTGTLNGGRDPNGNPYKIMLWARDGAPDTLRIRIWWADTDGTEHTIYDNGIDQALGGGSIVVHGK